MYDLNDAEPQRGGLIDPCYAKIIGVLRPGGVDGPAPIDRGLLKASKQTGSDVLMLDWEFTVAEGPNAHRKFWQNMTVAGGDLDEKGQSKGWNITKSQLRAMIDSALGLNPKDESEGARQRRMLRGFADLSGISFVAKIGIKKNKDPKFADQNALAHVVTPDEKEWQAVMSGQEVPIGGAAGWGQPAQAAWGGAQPAAPAAPPQSWGPPPAASPALASGWPGSHQQAAPAAPAAPAVQPGWPAAPAVPPQSQPAQAAPAVPAGWPAPQPTGWGPATAPAPAAAASAPMAGPAWLNG
ncbi:MAG: hypothetical protein GC191_18525 [Azospirillum sp.]|nr:hypothetical protein [Azospirillum sp.]